MIRQQFDNSRDRTIFLSLLIIILISPVLLGSYFYGNKKFLYCSSTDRQISTSICYNTFYENSDIDFLLLGFSSLWVGAEPNYVEKRIAYETGKKINVRTVATDHPGEDLLRVLYHDLHKQRKVKRVYTSQPNRSTPYPHPFMGHITTTRDLVYLNEGTTLIEKVRYYSILMTRTLKNLVSIIVPYDLSNMNKFNNLLKGATLRAKGWEGHKFKVQKAGERFISFSNKSQFNTYSSAQNIFTFDKENEVSKFQENSIFRLSYDVDKGGSKFGFVYFPLYLERKLNKISFKIDLRKLKIPQEIIGSPNANLFQGLSDYQTQEFFYNRNHFNYNGAMLFTELLYKEFKEQLK